MIATKQTLNLHIPSIVTLDLSFNQLYDLFEILSLKNIKSFYELDLQANPCCDSSDFEIEVIKEFPQLSIVNEQQLKRPNLIEQEIEEIKMQI